MDGNYRNTDLGQCATLRDRRNTRSSTYYVTWEVDLGSLYAIVSVTIYNTAVLPGIIRPYLGYYSYYYITETEVHKSRRRTFNNSPTVSVGYLIFSKRQRITLRLLYAMSRPSVCLSVCRLSVVCLSVCDVGAPYSGG